MTTNFTQTGTDIDKILIKQQYASLVPVSKRKSNWGTWTTATTLWAWGDNSFAELGLGNQTNYSSPVQVGSLTNWSTVCFGYYHTIANKTDGNFMILAIFMVVLL